MSNFFTLLLCPDPPIKIFPSKYNSLIDWHAVCLSFFAEASRIQETTMQVKHLMLGSALPAIMAAALTMGTNPANAAEILSFAQQTSGASPITTTATAGVTTFSTAPGTLVDVTCTGCGTPPPIVATLNITAVSVGAATNTAGVVTQIFDGSFSILEGATNVLSGTFTDAVFGANAVLTLSAGSGGTEFVSFSSSVIPAADLLPPLGISFSFAAVTPPVSTTPSGCSGTSGCTLGAATMSVSGTASATPVPEPSTLAIFGASLLALGGLITWRRKQRSA